MVAHGLNQGQCPRNIISVVLPGILNRFSHVGISGKVDNSRGFVLEHHFIQPVPVQDVAFFKQPPLHSPGMAVHHVVVRNRCIAGQGKRLACMAAYVPGASGDKDILLYAIHTIRPETPSLSHLTT